ncbi:bicaudal D-related protein homolog isoform X2 [Parasteatoda tepidariorum]|uniref:bicaudal D-related protein homolog isoform X2 n=1 Tax=Parasteatoda tepidariorum TaxID=114398 RepID=UPI001C719E40|nr:bicaudal D-related protein homolog isoform X2 [Parasteatoda tepidariorum]
MKSQDWLLEQEKHGLRRKLDVLESEYESRVAELQTDLKQMQKDIALQHTTHRTHEKEKGQLLEELTEQNHRLTAELKQSAKTEDQLQSQLQTLREQFNVRRSNLHDHVSQLEGLREEINLLSERKSELEKRISALNDEREGLNVSLEESSDRILLLEKRNREQEQQLRLQQRDIDELRQTNTHLQSKLDVVMRRCVTPSVVGGGDQPSLFNEMEMSSQSSVEDEFRSPSQCEGSKIPSHPSSSIGFHGDFLEDDIECDDCAMDTEDTWKFREELVPIYRMLRRLCEDLRRRRENYSSADSGISTHSPEEIQASEIRLGALTSITKELRNLIEEAIFCHDDDMCLSCQSLAEDRESLEKVQKELLEKNEEVKRKTEEISKLIAKVTLQEAELSALKETRDQLRTDMDNSSLAKDQVVKKAWEVRDQAVARKNAVEIELARTRIDVMHINSQLMEAVQQKVEISQQLEQWKMDMEVLLDNQVMKKLKTQEQEDKRQKTSPDVVQPQPPKRPARGKLFGLWRN